MQSRDAFGRYSLEASLDPGAKQQDTETAVVGNARYVSDEYRFSHRITLSYLNRSHRY